MATEEERAAAAAAGPGSPEALKVEEFDKAQAAKAEAEKASQEAAEAGDTPAKEAAPAEDLTLEPAPADVNIDIPATGNKVIDDVAKILVDKKIPNADSIMKEFAETGELSLSAQAALVDGLGESIAALAIKNLTGEASRLKDKGTKERTEILNYTNEKFNGSDAEKTWSELQAWTRSADSGISDEDRTVMTDMLKKGGLQARLVVDKIADLYFANANNSTPADLLAGDTHSNAGFTPISRKEYTDQLRVAVREYGEESVQVRDLNRKREISISRGY